jgi:hypothetical protein
MLCKIDALPEHLGRPETLLADNGYFSEANVTLCEVAKIEPLIALGRQPHHQSLCERFAAARSPGTAAHWERYATATSRQAQGRPLSVSHVCNILHSFIAG